MATVALASEGLIGRFGLDGRLLLAQAVNFFIVLFVLRRFVFRPLLEIMRKRTARIEEGMKKAEDIEREQEVFSRWQEEERKRVEREGAERLLRAEREAGERRGVLLRQAEGEARTMHDRAVADAERLHEEAMKRAHHGIAGLAVDVAERALGKTLPRDVRDDLLKEALQDVQKGGGRS